jgi:Protein of unknown function (DUF3631)
MKTETASDILREFGLPPPPPGKNRYYVCCPSCSATRSRAHQKSECLGITIDNEGVRFGCNHCDFRGGRKFVNGKDHVRGKNKVIEFPYQDENGNVLFVVERRETPILNGGKPDKKIKQKRADPDHPGKWLWNVEGVRVVPYCLPQLIEALADDHPVLIVEGEPKVDLLWSWNVAATCNAGGAGKWKPEHAAFLRGADVVLVPDHDEAGWKHIQTVGASLVGVAKRIRVLVLPNAKPKDDVIDWAKAGGTREQLDALIEQAQEWKPQTEEAEQEAEQTEEEKAKAKALEDQLLDALAKAEGLDYARRRKEAAKELEVSTRDIDTEVNRRREDAQVAPLYGHWIVEPWPEPVEGDSLLRDIIKRIKRHVIISDDGALTIALWIMLSWVHDEIATHSPILDITSAEPESGKSTTMSLVAFLMPKCIASVEASEAAIYRAIKRWSPSFCFDEFDSILADDDKAALRSVINSGHTRGQGVLRCIGDDKVPELFPTFAPKAIGMVGRKLPPATLSRCIFVELRRRKRDEAVEKFGHVDDNELADLRRRLRRWALDNQETLRDAKPSMPQELQNRRADNWQLQLAIADLCSGAENFGEKARAAAIKIEGKADNKTIGVRLLADIKALFDADLKTPCMHSADIVKKLVDDSEKSWGEAFRGKPLTQNRLARALGSYTPPIISQNVTPPGGTEAKGYRRSDFEEAWAIYVS